jgi:hypothetical protein
MSSEIVCRSALGHEKEVNVLSVSTFMILSIFACKWTETINVSITETHMKMRFLARRFVWVPNLRVG